MRNRHEARICRTCGSPMARQEQSCWSCGAGRATQAATPTPRRVTSLRARTDRVIETRAGRRRALAGVATR
jgi:ribosomal protein L37E